jgi:hypothetical protein
MCFSFLFQTCVFLTSIVENLCLIASRNSCIDNIDFEQGCNDEIIFIYNMKLNVTWLFF